MPMSTTPRGLRAVVATFAAAGAVAGAALTGAEAPVPRAVIVDMTAKRFAFLPEQVEVIEGDEVTINVRSADGTHGIEIARLKARKVVPRGGQAVTLSFSAPAPGRYPITCSEYCGRGHDDMKSVLVVAPRDSNASYLAQKLEGAADIVGTRMPRGAGPFLTPGRMPIIRRSIELGAKNDQRRLP